VSPGVAAPARVPAPAPRRAPRRRPAPRRAPQRRRAPTKRSRAATPAAGIPVAAVRRTAGAVGDIADSGLMVRLTRGRLWIGLLAALLVGIVGLNVLSLSFSSSAGRLAERSQTIERENSVLRAKLAQRLSSKRVEVVAASLGLTVPDPKDITYLSKDDGDPEVAARRLESGELGGAVDFAADTTVDATAYPTAAP